MGREERLLALADLAEGQWGLFTSAQVRELGFGAQQLKRMADAELITRLRHGVYRLTGVPEAPQDAIRAEWLALDPHRLASDRLQDDVPVGVVSHRSAAQLQDLGDLDADIHEFTVPKRRGTRSPEVKFHIRELAQQDWHLVAGLPVTRPLRTVIDLAAARIDGGHLATVARDAILTGDTTRDELAVALRPYAHHYGMPIGAGDKLLRNFIGHAGVPESAKALTRPDSGIDWVLLNPETNQTITLDAKLLHGKLRRPSIDAFTRQLAQMKSGLQPAIEALRLPDLQSAAEASFPHVFPSDFLPAPTEAAETPIDEGKRLATTNTDDHDDQGRA
ncbi:type IV toxin-antitoxin system AbiEi family antitoxin domain-containing protein [Nocardia cyriacigeorgica]|uniref:type IV toxin-antitoxin system AbiEi family antitoxin domain-containing protein n=1 Tax=Nocardia cyriacigeorgica TaxID=135487 RepID=UPI00245830C3|nr:type IV toxin-antitoxin system AbiEi family antitoxin domain-containing protein [Nocardia cyriacigeorgica]